MSIVRQKKCPCPGRKIGGPHTRTDCPHYGRKPLSEFTPEEHAARQCFAFRDATGKVIDPFSTADMMSPENNKLRQPTNPWMLDEVTELIGRKIEDCGEPDEGNEWEPDRYARAAAKALLHEGLITLRPGPLATPADIDIEQCIQWLEGLAARAMRCAPNSWTNEGIWPRDASEAQRVVNIVNALRSVEQ